MSPSPWSIRRPTESEVVGCVRKYPSIFAADGFSVCSFGATAKHGKRSPKDSEEDLRVIAAAPELLVALKMAQTWMETYRRQTGTGEHGILGNDIATVRATIAKAEGQA